MVQTAVTLNQTLTLVPIGISENRSITCRDPALLARIVADSLSMYQRNGGLTLPWVAYFATKGDQVVGACAFKSQPIGGQVEIGYFTFPGEEGCGVASQMVLQLLSLAQGKLPGGVVLAKTAPALSASVAILRRLGFVLTAKSKEPGPEHGHWNWELRLGAHLNLSSRPWTSVAA